MMQTSSIYIHFPFCVCKCDYCDFVSYPCFSFGIENLTSFYLKELDLYRKKFGERLIKTIYFGGGTPSLMKVNWIEKILERIYKLFNVDSDCEITLEVNPKTVCEEKLKSFYEIGINRLSIGIQSFDDKELRLLGRIHSSKDAFITIEKAKKYFSNISCDFIYALPNQNFEKWCSNLEQIKSLNLNHLSLYELIIEPKTPLYKMIKKGILSAIDENLALKMFEYTNKTLEKICPQYEISNYAKKGFESKHNLNYWNGGDYFGIGVSASGRIFDGKRFFISENPKSIDIWKKNISDSILSVKCLSKKNRAEELLIMGLRKNSGIDFDKFKQKSLVDFFDIVNMEKVQNLVSKKLLILSENNIKLSFWGRNLLDAILREIIK